MLPRLFHHHTVRKHVSQGLKFIVCGGTGFTLDLLSLTLFVEVVHIDARIAVILSSIVGATFVFFANKLFTFQNRERRYGRQALKFVMVYGISLGLNVAISNVLLFIGLHYLLAKIVAVGIGAVWNYALSHGFIFRKTVGDVTGV